MNNTPAQPVSPVPIRGRAAIWLLAIATLAVCFTAADTYVVVLALPDIMHGVGLSVEQLHQGAPILSGFLLGYIAMLPLIGRIADIRGRQPVLMAGLMVFAVGSFVTALSFGMPTIVAGRFLQGVGAGALVPATMALVADLFPVQKRAMPLGLVSAAQEVGAVLGPLLGALVLAITDWRAIFALNLVVALGLAWALRRAARRHAPQGAAVEARPTDWISLSLLSLIGVGSAVLVLKPPALVRDITWGQLYIPTFGTSDWWTPLGLAVLVCTVGLVWRCVSAAYPLVDLRRWWTDARQADLTGALFLALALGGVVLAFSLANPEESLLSPLGAWYLAVSGIALVAFIVRQRTAASPLIPAAAIAPRPAWGALLVSFFVGAALVVALVDIPLFARTTGHADTQLNAALVLLQFLVALPVGAIAGGWLVRHLAPSVIASLGLVAAAGAFGVMSTWQADSLGTVSASIVLILGGFGFGLALAPVNHAMLAAVPAAVHGVASAATVVARMIGMLVGLSVLTAAGLAKYYAEQSDLPPVQEVCDGLSRCDAFTDLIRAAGIAQEQTVFAGACAAALIGAVLALLFLGKRPGLESDS